MVYVGDRNERKLGEALGRCTICGSRNNQCSLGPISAHPVAALQLTALATALNQAGGHRWEEAENDDTKQIDLVHSLV